MACADDDRPSLDSAPKLPPRRNRWASGMACVAILPLLGFIGLQVPSLWGEFSGLKLDQRKASISAPVGYLAINPAPSYADRPTDWFHNEGEHTLIWSGWKDGQNRWFRTGRGDLYEDQLSKPLGRDAIQAIDFPLYQNDGGQLWANVPDDSSVAGLDLSNQTFAYPLKVLEKVEVINDHIGQRPILVAFAPLHETITVYDSTIEGRRMTMGHSGYFLGSNPVLYDRGTESLWVSVDSSMTAVTGKLKGRKLPRISTLKAEPWGDWRARNPNGRLLVGADRSRKQPTE